MDIGSFAIMQSNNVVFSSKDYSGYLGVGPYSRTFDSLNKLQNENLKNNSLLYQLKDKGFTDSTVVSFYLTKEGLSTIKFGSYDSEALKFPDKFTILRTIDETRWWVKGSNVNVHGINI